MQVLENSSSEATTQKAGISTNPLQLLTCQQSNFHLKSN